MVCRLAGMPVPQRSAAVDKRAASGDDADKKAEAVNGHTLSSKNLRFDFSVTQTDCSREVWASVDQEASCR